MPISLGIDTGGTYTDAVLLDTNDKIIATAKSLTTRYDLAEGIQDVIKKLPKKYFSEIELVSLSTTLATNAIIEGQGMPVLGIFAGYTENQLDNVKVTEIIGAENTFIIKGGHKASGDEKEVLDIELAREIITKNYENVSAIAISSMFSVRNSNHEKELVKLAKSICDKPITCGYQLADSLDAPKRALTAVLNASLIEFIRELILSVKDS